MDSSYLVELSAFDTAQIKMLPGYVDPQLGIQVICSFPLAAQKLLDRLRPKLTKMCVISHRYEKKRSIKSGSVTDQYECKIRPHGVDEKKCDPITFLKDVYLNILCMCFVYYEYLWEMCHKTFPFWRVDWRGPDQWNNGAQSKLL